MPMPNFQPEWLIKILMKFRYFLFIFLYYGNSRFCPICEKLFRKFKKYGFVPRKEARCPFCGGLERHRVVWLYFKNVTNLFDKQAKKVLHVAPEKCFEKRLKNRLGDAYITADISNPRAMVKMDITDIQYPDESFNVIYCSHVLEHIENDKKAMQELYRVLKTNGWAILIVPVNCKKTIEDPSITSPLERLKLYGKEDHVRNYGLDYLDRLREAGFNVRVDAPTDFIKKENLARMGLTKALKGNIYFCTKGSEKKIKVMFPNA